MFELKTLEDYSDEALLSELHRIATELKGERLTKRKFDTFARTHSSTLEKRFGSWKNALDLAGISESIAPRINVITREKLVSELQAYAKEFPDRTSVTQSEIAKRLKVRNTSIAKAKKFGTWGKLLIEAGFSSVPHGRRYTDEECYENIVALWTHYGRQPNFAELNQPPSRVGAKAYIRRWGGWRSALSAFIKYINHDTPKLTPTPVVSEYSESKLTTENISRSISLALRYKILCRDHFRCVICGRSPAKEPSIELHVDHIHPWSKGGQNTEGNLRILCFDCNLGKGAKVERLI